MKNKLSIGFDIDGVLYSFHQAAYTEFVVYYDLKEDFYSFWTEGYKTYKSAKFWDNFVETRHIYSTQAPNKKDVEFIQALVKAGHNIYYISNRPMIVLGTTLRWLEKYNFPLSEQTIFTDDKIRVCKNFKIDLIFEDREKNIQALLDANIPVIAIRQPYNRWYLDLHPELTVLENVYEFNIESVK